MFPFVVYNLGPECNEKFIQNDPLSCKFPYPNYPEDKANACSETCRNDDCCFSKCIFEAIGIYTGGELLVDNYVDGFEYNDSEAKAIWTPIVKQSFETCYKQSKNYLNFFKFSN